MSQNGCAQTTTPPASWIASDGLRDGGGLAQAEGGLALDQVAADQRADVVDLLVPQSRGVRGRGEHRFGQVRAPDRLAGGDALLELRAVELEAELLQRRGHPQRALLAVGEELGESRGEGRVGVVDVVAEDVQFARRLPVGVDRGDLDRGNHLHAVALARAQRLGDAGDGVVVAQRQQLDAGARGALHDLGGLERAVGVRRVRLQVEADRAGHRQESVRDRRRSPHPGRGLGSLSGSERASGRRGSAAGVVGCPVRPSLRARAWPVATMVRCLARRDAGPREPVGAPRRSGAQGLACSCAEPLPGMAISIATWRPSTSRRVWTAAWKRRALLGSVQPPSSGGASGCSQTSSWA